MQIICGTEGHNSCDHRARGGNIDLLHGRPLVSHRQPVLNALGTERETPPHFLLPRRVDGCSRVAKVDRGAETNVWESQSMLLSTPDLTVVFSERSELHIEEAEIRQAKLLPVICNPH